MLISRRSPPFDPRVPLLESHDGHRGNNTRAAVGERLGGRWGQRERKGGVFEARQELLPQTPSRAVYG